MWLVGVGGIYGCGYWGGCKEVYSYYLSLLLLYLFFFTAASLLFVHFFNVFRSCSSTFLLFFYPECYTQ